jgi:TfoX/Sxy family transcriptional regulator of competence genes
MTNQTLTSRVRSAFANVALVEERRMFGGVAFLVDGKMCVSVGTHRLMCRIDPSTHEMAIGREGCRTVTMNGRPYRGYVHVAEAAVANDVDLRHWIRLALDYNPRAKPHKRRATVSAAAQRRG